MRKNTGNYTLSTARYSICRACSAAVRSARPKRKVRTGNIFFIITDSHENRRYTAAMIQERINHQKQKYGWEFLFFGANMDAIAEAAKIGIAADRAQNYCANSVGTSSVYSSMSAMSRAFRTGKPFSSMDLTGKTPWGPRRRRT